MRELSRLRAAIPISLVVERELKIGIVPCRSPSPHSGEKMPIGKPFWVSGEDLILLHPCPGLSIDSGGVPTHVLAPSSAPWICPECEAQISYPEVWAAFSMHS